MPTDAMQVPAALPYDLARTLAAGPLVRVVVGSHLHGFATPDSDHDSWVVVNEPRDHSGTWAAKKVWQTVERHDDKPDVDVTVVGLSTWLRYCEQGVPQALDVMMAHGPAVEVDSFPHLRASYRANPNAATPLFRRMMNQVVQQRAGMLKQRRHAFRLALNLLDVQATGRYRPALSSQQRALVLSLAEDEAGFVGRLSRFSGLAFDD